MGIDIVRLREDQLIAALGDGEWYLTMPTGDPDLVVPTAWRQQVIETACGWFVRWVINGRDIKIIHDADPPWDHSGQARSRDADPLMLLIRHASLETWLDAEHTGQSRASFMSGMGLYWETYKEKLREEIEDKVYQLLKVHWIKLHNYPEDFDVWEDPLWEELASLELALQLALSLCVNQISTADAWKQFEHIIRAQIEDERRLAAIRKALVTAMNERVQQFWRQHFSDLIGHLIEYPQFRDTKLGERIADVLADTDPQVVEAVAELGLPGYFSNSVKSTIKQIAQDALNTPKPNTF